MFTLCAFFSLEIKIIMIAVRALQNFDNTLNEFRKTRTNFREQLSRYNYIGASFSDVIHSRYNLEHYIFFYQLDVLRERKLFELVVIIVPLNQLEPTEPRGLILKAGQRRCEGRPVYRRSNENRNNGSALKSFYLGTI